MEIKRPCPFCGSFPVEIDPQVQPSFAERWTCSTLRAHGDKELMQTRRCKLYAASGGNPDVIDRNPPK